MPHTQALPHSLACARGPPSSKPPPPHARRLSSEHVLPASPQYERLTHNRLIDFYGLSTVSSDATKIVSFLRYFEHSILEANPGASAKITLFSDEMLGEKS